MIKEQSPIGDIKLAYGVDDNPSLSKKFTIWNSAYIRGIWRNNSCSISYSKFIRI